MEKKEIVERLNNCKIELNTLKEEASSVDKMRLYIEQEENNYKKENTVMITLAVVFLGSLAAFPIPFIIATFGINVLVDSFITLLRKEKNNMKKSVNIYDESCKNVKDMVECLTTLKDYKNNVKLSDYQVENVFQKSNLFDQELFDEVKCMANDYGYSCNVKEVSDLDEALDMLDNFEISEEQKIKMLEQIKFTFMEMENEFMEIEKEEKVKKIKKDK